MLFVVINKIFGKKLKEKEKGKEKQSGKQSGKQLKYSHSSRSSKYKKTSFLNVIRKYDPIMLTCFIDNNT